MNNFLNSAASRIVGVIGVVIGVVTLIGIMKWIFDDVFSTALITLVIIQWFINILRYRIEERKENECQA